MVLRFPFSRSRHRRVRSRFFQESVSQSVRVSEKLWPQLFSWATVSEPDWRLAWVLVWASALLLLSRLGSAWDCELASPLVLVWAKASALAAESRSGPRPNRADLQPTPVPSVILFSILSSVTATSRARADSFCRWQRHRHLRRLT